VLAAAKAATKGTKSIRAKPTPRGSTTKIAPEKKVSSGLSGLSRVEQLGLLSKVEQLGLLSLAESSGLTLSKIQQSGLLSQLEKSGLLTVIADRKTPIALNTLGLLLIAGAGALALLPDGSTAEFVGQAAGATVLVASALAIFVASSLLDALQKP
jgi:hypothetical protein